MVNGSHGGSHAGGRVAPRATDRGRRVCPDLHMRPAGDRRQRHVEHPFQAADSLSPFARPVGLRWCHDGSQWGVAGRMSLTTWRVTGLNVVAGKRPRPGSVVAPGVSAVSRSLGA